MKAKNKLGINWVTIFRDQEKSYRSNRGIGEKDNRTKGFISEMSNKMDLNSDVKLVRIQ